MAVKREFGVEKQSSEFKERTDLQNPKAGKTENIDALVSHFLAELSDLSSEMNKSGKPESDPASAHKAENAKLSSLIGLQEAAESGPDPDLEQISGEIERSLVELETLKPALSAPWENPLPDAESKPAEPAAMAKDEPPVEPAGASTIVDPEEQAWNRLEVFRGSVARSKEARRRSIAWILAGVVLIGMLGVSAFDYFSSDSGTSETTQEVPGIETKNSETAPEQVKSPPAIAGKPLAISDSKKYSKSVDLIKAPAPENNKNKPVPQSASRTAETTVGRRNGSGGTTGIEGPTESTIKESSAEKVRASDEPPKLASAQVAGAATEPVQLPAPASTPANAATQPKSSPAAPDGTADVPAIGNVTTPASPSVREVTPPAPKPAPPVINEVPGTAAPPKPRTAVMAEAIKKVPPVYPSLARARKISGRVEVEAEINDNGDVFQAKAVSGPDMLRAAAEEALRKWKFKPASVDGVNVPSKARIVVNFNAQ